MSPADKLRQLLDASGCITMPCCFDALSARLIEQSGFPLTFMSGFAVSAARIAQPDTGLMSYSEVLDQARNICEAVDMPVIGDGDTGYGNAMNVKRTVSGFAKAGLAAVMIEDQLAPKRCGHTKGKQVVSDQEAFDRIRAAVDAREEGSDILILARTDARHQLGLTKAIDRALEFKKLGADILFVEAPRSEKELWEICENLPGPLMANMLEGGKTPMPPVSELAEMGYSIAAYPLTLLSAAMKAMLDVLATLKTGEERDHLLMDFDELKTCVGFDDYYEQSVRYETSKRQN